MVARIGRLGRRQCRVRQVSALALSCACIHFALVGQPAFLSFGDGYKLNKDDLLGSGGYAKVYKCQDSAGKLRAVKQVFSGDAAALENEITVHRQIGKHENIVQLIEAVDVDGDMGKKMIVMELATGGELTQYIAEHGKLDEDMARGIFRQLVSAVEHLHAQHVIHRDLKTDNILLCTDSTHDERHPLVKLIDFGAGHWARDGPLEASKFIGTLKTMAPEVILARGDDFDASDATQVDATHEVEFRVRPFGIREYKPGKNGKGARVVEMISEERYKGDPLAQAWKKGVREGWVVKSVGGVDVSDMDFDEILDLLGDRLLDNGSRGAFDGSYRVTGDNLGNGKVLPKVEMAELPVSVEYAQLKERPYGAKADVWSLGVVLYTMVMGREPFAAEEAAILAGAYPDADAASPALRDLISRMLVVDPEARAGVSEVALHPWMQRELVAA